MKKLILAVAAVLTMSTSAFAQLGSTDKDLVYTPVTPCRVLDTRTTQGGSGPIPAEGTKHFKIWDAASGYAFQGGSPTNCGLTASSNIAAVAMNFTVVTPASGGFITAYPFGGAVPVAATVNFQVGDIARGDFSIAKVAQTGDLHLSIFSKSNTDVVGDVVGYYSRPVATALQCTTVGASRTLSANFNNFNTVTTACPAGYASVSAYCYNNSNSSSIISTGSGAYFSTAFCGWRNTSASAVNVYEGLTCCRIPGI